MSAAYEPPFRGRPGGLPWPRGWIWTYWRPADGGGTPGAPGVREPRRPRPDAGRGGAQAPRPPAGA